MSGRALVNEGLITTEKKKSPSSCSVQACELHALKGALEISALERGTVYTDSKCAFGAVHTFGKIWGERGLLSSKGKGPVHAKLISEVLEALQLPKEIAVVHIWGHQKGTTLEIGGAGEFLE